MRTRRLASSVETSVEIDAKKATPMIMRLTAMKKMTLMTIARRTTTQKTTISMTTMRKTTKMAKLSIQWMQTMVMNSLMSV